MSGQRSGAISQAGLVSRSAPLPRPRSGQPASPCNQSRLRRPNPPPHIASRPYIFLPSVGWRSRAGIARLYFASHKWLILPPHPLPPSAAVLLASHSPPPLHPSRSPLCAVESLAVLTDPLQPILCVRHCLPSGLLRLLCFFAAEIHAMHNFCQASLFFDLSIHKNFIFYPSMKTTLDIPEYLFSRATLHSKARTKRAIVIQAMEDFIQRAEMKALARSLGDSETFMTSAELDNLRSQETSLSHDPH